MSTTHIVRDGEHLPGIAARHGHFDWRPVWNAPENAELRAVRDNPCVLHAGDVVTIPDPAPPEAGFLPAQTGKFHRFELREPPLELRVRLQDPFGAPLAGVACELELDGVTYDLVADGDGVVAHPIRPTTTAALLRVDGELELTLAIGALDPASEPSGQEARLANLAYYPGQPGDHDEELLKFAVQLFQRDAQLPIDGDAAAIADPLREGYGL